MQRCKKCKEVISLELADIIAGRGLFGTKGPKAVNKESIKKGLCRQCFEMKVKDNQ